jgi:pimeloyl-ACP methyl ester carboxylesterase
MPLARAGNLNLEYYVEGEGPPLLMIMGFGGQASSWGEPFLGRLRSHFTLVRFSNRGTGRSDRPPGQFSVRDMADDAVAVLEAAGFESGHVLGVSMGGMIAQELAINHPRSVLGLVLGCTLPGGPHSVTASPEVVANLLPRPGLSREEQVRKTWPVIASAEFLETGRDFLEEMLRVGLETPTPVETLMLQAAAVQGFDAYDRLPQVQAPTLIIHGDADRLVPVENARILQRRLPNSQVKVLPGAGHVFFWEQPEAAAGAVIDFLSRVSVKA